MALLENDGWNEGILAIGTLGVDLYQDFKTKDDTFLNNNQVLFFEDGGDIGDHDDEMESPLVRKACEHVFDDHVEKKDLSPCDEVDKLENHQENLVVKGAMKVRKSGERTTLADLLREDSKDYNLLEKLSDDDHKINDDDNNNDIGAESVKSFLISKYKKKNLGKNALAQPIKKTKRVSFYSIIIICTYIYLELLACTYSF